MLSSKVIEGHLPNNDNWPWAIPIIPLVLNLISEASYISFRSSAPLPSKILTSPYVGPRKVLAKPLIPGLSVPLAANSKREFIALSVYHDAMYPAGPTGPLAVQLSKTHFAADPAAE